MSDQKNMFMQMLLKPIVKKYALFSLIITVLVLIFYNVPLLQNTGFFMRLISVPVGVTFGTIGGILGVGLKAVYVPNTSSVASELFWTIGPQSVGVLLGSILGACLLPYIFN